jgi:Zn-dependent protease with chaperone function/uncharacterized tellurite resistance protein B-like protein
MDFFERQEKARRNTKLLVVYFVTGVALLILVIYLVVATVFSATGLRHRGRHSYYNNYDTQLEVSRHPLWNPQLFCGVAIGTLAVIGIGSLFKTMELAQGGSAVSSMMGGRMVNPNTTDLDERKLLNVVEEMALASGVPVPQVYVMDSEQGINAFAAGHTTSDATITVTRGCMKLLTRDELQGVIAHEFSHVLNGDMRLNLRLLGIIFGILCLAVIGRILLYTRGNSRDRNALPLLGLALLAIGYVGVFFGRLIQAGVSRQREFLADASAVQFTRNPLGVTGALKKIGGLGENGSRVSAAHSEEVSHMFFGNGLATPLFGLLATHPPLEERIRAIDPNFDGTFPKTRYVPEEESPYRVGQAAASARRPAFPPLVPVAMAAVMPNLGTPSTAHLHYAVELRNSFPAALKNAARDAMGASALVYGLLISTDPAMRAQQLGLLAQNTSDAVRQETERLLPEIVPVATNAKLPLVDLALPGLRQLSPTQYQQFSKAIQALIEADGEIDLFEYVLQKIVLRHLDTQFNGARKQVVQYYALKPLAPDCSVLLSALAHVSSDDPTKCEAAFQSGARSLEAYAQSPLVYVASEQCDLSQVDAALNRLNQAVAQIKKSVLNACVQVVAADGVIQEMEAELLRAIADALDCPMPPFLQTAQTPAGE